MSRPLRIAIITTDARHWLREFETETPNFGTAIRGLLEGFAEISEVEVHVISASPSPLPSLKKIAANISYHHVHVAKWGWGKSLFVGVAWHIQKLLRQIQPDIVHGQGTERDCAMAAVLSNFPNVLTIHGNMQELQRLGYHGNAVYGRLVSLLETYTLGKTLGVFCNSAHTESLVRSRARNTWLVPNSIRSAFFQSSTADPESKIPILLNVGMVYPLKRQLEILKSLRQLKHSGHHFKIIFAGDLSENSDYGKRFVEELKAAEREGIAEYAGFLDVDGLIQLMDRCSGFIHFPAEEAFGLVVAEAMTRGLKVFGANLGGIIDIAEGIEGAELFDQLDEMQAGIARWLDAGAHRCPEAAAEIAKRYHPKVIAKRHMEIYREVLGR
jgi:glycosyltransferase involved in cell wall biosynthesis